MNARSESRKRWKSYKINKKCILLFKEWKLHQEIWARKMFRIKEKAIIIIQPTFVYTEETLQTRLIEGLKKNQKSRPKLAHTKQKKMEKDENKLF